VDIISFMGFAENLRDELNYQDMTVKELAVKTGISQHTMSHYLSGKKNMPPADTAVKIASVLGVTVEYLVTGKPDAQTATMLTNLSRDLVTDLPKYIKFRDMFSDLPWLPADSVNTIKTLVKILAAKEQEKQKHTI
jgi:transcriptional regulator with XRE-family HTH domain